MRRVGRRREFDLNPDRARVFEVRNPIARARYKSLQRRLARSQGREDAGAFTGQYLQVKTILLLKKRYFNAKKKRKDPAVEAERIRLNKIKNETRGNKIQQRDRLN